LLHETAAILARSGLCIDVIRICHATPWKRLARLSIRSTPSPLAGQTGKYCLCDLPDRAISRLRKSGEVCSTRYKMTAILP
jgi:hypothetical protein